MTTLTLAQFQVIADSLARQYERLIDANATTAATDVRTGAANNQGRVVVLAPDLVEALIPGVNAGATQATTLTKAALILFGDALRGLNRSDVLGAAGIDAFLTAQGGQVSRSFADLFALVFTGQTIKPANVFPPQTTLAAFSVTAAGAGTFGGTGVVDTTRYGPARCAVETTSAIGAAAITATLTMLLFGGATTATRTVTIPAGAALGTQYLIGATTDKYIDCTAIAIGATDGTAGDAFRVQAQLLRTVAL